ncbi:MAG: putative ABC exporter domain-containing protein [Christensenellales bacterium]|jgi:hypothetical protein
MSALIYLYLRTKKNRLKELLRRPQRLIPYALFLVALGMVIFSANVSDPEGVFQRRDKSELYAIVTALYAMVFLSTSFKGFGDGASFFTMPDIHFLFPAPISSRRILSYGLIRQIGTSLMLGVFIIFQYSWVHQLYGVTFLQLLYVLLGYAAVIFCGQLTAMIIYSFISGREKRSRALRTAFIAVVLALLAYVASAALQNLDDTSRILPAVVSALTASWVRFMPVFGWAQSFVMSLTAFNLLGAALSLAAICGYVALLIFVVGKMGSDYYEDVLKATEVAFSAITAAKENRQAAQVSPGKVKVGKTGLGRGKGASAFYYKHKLENRRAKSFIVDRLSLIFILVGLVFALFMRSEGLIPAFMFMTYMQIFQSMTGRWTRDLLFPYVYMIPEPPFKKLVMLLGEQLRSFAVEAVIVAVAMAFIIPSPPLDLAALALARFGFSALFMAANILHMRLFGSMTNKGLTIAFYFLTVFILAMPGIVMAIVFGLVMSLGAGLPLAMTFVWNLLISGIILFACRNLLNVAELNNQ